MANIRAVKSGNWSDTTVWNGGVLPNVNDVAVANTYTITIDQDISVQALANNTLGTSTNGGFFQITTVSGTRNIALSLGLGSSTYIGAIGGLLRISATSGTVALGSTNITGGGTLNYVALLISGNGITVTQSGTVNGGVTSGTYGISITAAATITTGNVTGGNVGSAYGINITAAAIVTTGTVTGGNGTSTYGIQITAAATITTGNVTGGSGTSSNAINIIATESNITTGTVTGGIGGTAYGIYVDGVGTNLTTGNILGSASPGSAHGVYVNSSKNIIKTGTITGSTAIGLTLANSYNTLTTGNLIGASSGTNGWAVNSFNVANNIIDVQGSLTANAMPAIRTGTAVGVFRYRGPINNSTTRCAIEGDRFFIYGGDGIQTTYAVYDSDNNAVTLSNYHAGSPPPSDVRKGVTYGPNSQLTGTMAVPTASSVNVGVSVDNTTGTAVLTGAKVLDSEIASGVSIKTRINNTATISGTGDQLQAGLS